MQDLLAEAPGPDLPAIPACKVDFDWHTRRSGGKAEDGGDKTSPYRSAPLDDSAPAKDGMPLRRLMQGADRAGQAIPVAPEDLPIEALPLVALRLHAMKRPRSSGVGTMQLWRRPAMR
ncbi:hypothetical protein D9M68_890700 [compost metagenome]